MKTLYHGSRTEIESIDINQPMYFSESLDHAKEYALGLNDLGEYNQESWIYSIEINEKDITEIEDFGEFDIIGYNDKESMPNIAFNEESGYYCVKDITEITLVESYKNEL